MSADRYQFYKGRARGVGDPISMVTFHHPKKKHFFGVWKDGTDFDPAKPFMPLTKIKLRIDQYPMLTITCPHLDRKEARFIVVFVEKDKRVTWAKSV